jgi:sorbitol/mannitol transport system permease protein
MAPPGPLGEAKWVSKVSAIVAWILGFVFFFPVLWMVLSAFKTEKSAQTVTPNLQLNGGFNRFREVTKELKGTVTFSVAFKNSATIVIISTVIVLLLAIPAAYALAIRPVPKWRDALMFFISTKFLPIAAAIVPLYSIYSYLHKIDTRLGMIVLYTSMNLPLAIWMLRSFFAEVPRELVEAAEIDGATFFQRVRTVLLPIVMPGVAATALLCFIFGWNEYFLAVNLTGFKAQTMSVWVTSFQSTRGQFLAKLSAAATLTCLPVILAGWVAQKKLVRGLTMGAVK